MARRIDPQEVYSYLLGKGLTPNHAVGMLNNIQHESAFQPAINEIAPLVPGSRGGYGLFQHTGPRRRALEAFAGGQVADWRKQIDYALTEPDTERYLGQDFSDPGEASQWFTTEWERPANKEQKARQRMRTLGQFAQLADMPMPDVRMAADYGAGGSMTTGSTNPMDVAGDPVTGRMMTPLLGDIPSAPTDDYASREMRRLYGQLLGQDEDQPQTMLGVAAGALKQAGEAFNRLPLGYQYTAAGVRPVESTGSLAYKAELARGSKDKTRAQLGLLEAMSREQRGERADARSHADRVYRERKDAADRERQARIDRLNEADAAARSSRADTEFGWKEEDRERAARQSAAQQEMLAALGGDGGQPTMPGVQPPALEPSVAPSMDATAAGITAGPGQPAASAVPASAAPAALQPPPQVQRAQQIARQSGLPAPEAVPARDPVTQEYAWKVSVPGAGERYLPMAPQEQQAAAAAAGQARLAEDGAAPLRKELGQQIAVKTYEGATPAFRGLANLLATKENPFSDLGSVYTFMKALDPTSTVRESEAGMVVEASGPMAQLASMLKKVQGEGRFSDEQRKQMMEAAKAPVQGMVEEAQREYDEYAKYAQRRFGVDDPTQVLGARPAMPDLSEIEKMIDKGVSGEGQTPSLPAISGGANADPLGLRSGPSAGENPNDPLGIL